MPVPDYPQVYGAPPKLPGSHLRAQGKVGPSTIPCRVVMMTDGRRPAMIERTAGLLRARGGAEFDIVRTPGRGHAEDLWWLFKEVADSGDLLVLEDDIVPCWNAVKYMRDFDISNFEQKYPETRDDLSSDMALMSFFDMRHLVGMYPQILWVRPEAHDGLGFMGTQAFKIGTLCRRTIVSFGPPKSRTGDIAMSRALEQAGGWVAMHAPSLVQHDDPRQTLNFVGPDFDADLLMR